MADASLRPGRSVLKAAAGLAAAPALVAVPARAQVPARASEFDFPSGEWRIRNRRLKAPDDWDQITATSCRWRQGASRDGGATWDWSWIMQWSRVA